jgi:hypothetical protein
MIGLYKRAQEATELWIKHVQLHIKWTLWIHKGMTLRSFTICRRRQALDKKEICAEPQRPPPGVVLYDKMRSDTRKVIGGSNGSLYPDDKVMTAAWIVATDEEHFT